ncbi:MAG TPA: hypothetical protein VLF18_18340 [Tahibacter sp.]|nr:hypothetical protein [Tahibacter sp.]
MIRDVGKSDLPREDSSTPYLALQSKMLPLAVPKTNYAKVDKWTHGNYGYAKVATKISYSTWKNLDLVAATPRLDTDEATFEQNHLRFEAALTFWFSPESGVVAIAFPDRSSALADTYFCSRTPCLFAGGMVKP